MPMTYYQPDHKYEQAKKVIEELSINNEEESLILYYIKKHQDWHDEDSKRLKEYYDFFDKLNKFLPNNNPIFK